MTALAIEPPKKATPTPPVEAPGKLPDNQQPNPRPEAQKPQQEAQNPRPFLGVILDPVPEMLASHLNLKPGEGVMVLETLKQGPAEKAGLKAHDVIVEINGKPVGSVDDVRAITAQHQIDDEIKLTAYHNGKRQHFPIVLEAAPDRMPAPQAPNMGQLPREFQDGPFLDNLPDKHADMIREALRRNLQALENPRDLNGLNQNDDLHQELMQRMQDMQGQLENMGNLQLKMNGNIESSVRLLDNQGSIEMKSRNGNRHVKVFDKQGELIWEGPYDTEQDKAAVPEDISKRIERLDFNIEDNGFKMHFHQGKFRKLDDLDQDN